MSILVFLKTEKTLSLIIHSRLIKLITIQIKYLKNDNNKVIREYQ